MRRLRSVTVNGKRWRVVWGKLRKQWGCTDKASTIWMDASIRDNVTATNILIHEMLHCMWPDVEEESITQRADELALALYRAQLIAEDA